MSFETRTYVWAAVGALATVALVSPTRPWEWALLGLLLLGNAQWVARRIRSNDAVQEAGE